MTKFPTFIIRRSRLPVWFGHLFIGRPFAAQTIGPWIHFPTDQITMPVLVHESRHVAQFYIGWLAGVVLWAVFAWGWWWWLLATPFTFTLAYVLAGFYAMARGGAWYHDNPFEQDARRHAGEPV